MSPRSPRRANQARPQLELLLLGVIAVAPAHGYALISALRERSQGVFDLAEGAVYPVLHKLEDAGMVSSDWEAVAGRRRRVYRLTELGTAALERERAGWQRFSRAVDAVLAAAERGAPGALEALPRLPVPNGAPA